MEVEDTEGSGSGDWRTAVEGLSVASKVIVGIVCCYLEHNGVTTLP